MVKFSIIIPVYNTGKFLEQCVSSVINQTFRDFEIILVDDGSSDDSLQICKYFENRDCRVRVVSQENKGVCSARNKGLSLATGEYVTFIDSDDYISEHLLTTISDAIDNNGYDVYSYLGVYLINGCVEEENISTTQSFTAHNKDEIKENINIIIQEGCSSVCTQFYKLSIVKENNIKFDENIQLNEEMFFNLNLLRYIGSFQFLNLPMYFYRIHNNSSSNRGSDKIVELALKKIEFFNNYKKQTDILEHLLLTEKDMLIEGIVSQFIQSTISTNRFNYNERTKILQKLYKNNKYYKILHSEYSFKKNDFNTLICKISIFLKMPIIIAVPVTIKKYINKKRVK